MKVVVRVRPDNDQENGSRTVISVIDEQLLIFDPKEDYDDFYFQGVKQKDFLRKSNKNMEFMFDRVFDGHTLNSEVYEHTTLAILDGLLDGYNCSVFAYGATGAGKTFTMLGDLEHPGITFLTMVDLYRRIDAAKAEKTIDVAVSYLEVYNENIRDLLSPGLNLQIREDPQRGVVVAGLKLCKPTAANELLDMLRNGNKNRTQHPTDANAESSRSHAVFTVYVKQHERSGKKSTKVAKMSLIDLAGSERATMVSKNRGSRMREGANINKSLLALGNCINALAERKAKVHIPYRNSKLTRLLKDSLDGNCRTIMIAAVSPSANSYEDTYNTLKYAMRAKNIKMNLKQNVVNVDLHLNQYAKLVEELRKKVSSLEAELRQKNESTEAPPRRVEIVAPMQLLPVVGPSAAEVEAKRCLEQLFAERLSLQRHYLHVVSQLKTFELKIQRRQQKLFNLSFVSVDAGKLCDSTTRADKTINSFKSRHASLLEKTAVLDQELGANQAKLTEKETSVDSFASKEFQKYLVAQKLMLDIQQEKQRSKHLELLAMQLDVEYTRSNSLSCSMMKVIRRQFLLLKANSLATCDVEQDYTSITKLVEGCNAVSWADPIDTNEAPEGDDSPIVHWKNILNLNLPSLANATEGEFISAPILTVLPQDTPDISDSVNTMPQACCGVATVIRNDPITGQSFTKLRKIDCMQTRKKSESPLLVVPASRFAPSELNSPRVLVGTKRQSDVLEECDTTFTLTPPLAVPSPLAKLGCNQTFVKSTPTYGRTVANLTFTDTPRSPLAQTNGRRLTFDAPGPSILKTMEDKIAASPNLVSQREKENAVASVEKQKTVHTLLRKTRSYQNLPPKDASNLDLNSIKALDKLKQEGFPAVTDKTSFAREPEKQKSSWGLKNLKMKAFKSAVKPVDSKPPISSGTKPHPYQPLQAQRQKVHQSTDNLTESGQKRTQPLRSYNGLPSITSKSRLPNPSTKHAPLLRKSSQSMSNLGALMAKKS